MPAANSGGQPGKGDTGSPRRRSQRSTSPRWYAAPARSVRARSRSAQSAAAVGRPLSQLCSRWAMPVGTSHSRTSASRAARAATANVSAVRSSPRRTSNRASAGIVSRPSMPGSARSPSNRRSTSSAGPHSPCISRSRCRRASTKYECAWKSRSRPYSAAGIEIPRGLGVAPEPPQPLGEVVVPAHHVLVLAQLTRSPHAVEELGAARDVAQLQQGRPAVVVGQRHQRRVGVVRAAPGRAGPPPRGRRAPAPRPG